MAIHRFERRKFPVLNVTVCLAWMAFPCLVGILAIRPCNADKPLPTGQLLVGPHILQDEEFDSSLLPDLGRKDVQGDPLPDGSRLRLGTTRFIQPSYVAELGLSTDEKHLVTVGRTIVVWDAETGEEKWRAPSDSVGLRFSGAAYATQVLEFAADGKHFYTPGAVNQIIEWNLESGEHRVLRVETPAVRGGAIQSTSFRSIDLSPDGKQLALGRADGLYVVNLDGDLLYQSANEARGPIEGRERDRLAFHGHFSIGQFSPDGNMIAILNSDNPLLVRICKAEDGEVIHRLELDDWLVEMHFSPDNRQLAVAERDGSVRVYSVQMGGMDWEHVFELNNPFENYTSAVAYSPDGHVLAVAATDYNIYLMNPETGELMETLKGHDWYPLSIDYSDDSKTLITGGYDDIIRRWDIESASELALSEGVHAGGATATSPNGMWIAYSDDRGIVHLISSRDGQEIRSFDPDEIQAEGMTFSADSQRIAVGGSANDEVGVVVFDVQDAGVVQSWTWPKGPDPHASVEELAFSPDGKQIAAGIFRQNKIYVWDVEMGEQRATLEHSNVYGLSFSPDGTSLLSGGWDSHIRIWDAETFESKRAVAVGAVADGVEDPRVYGLCCSPTGELVATTHIGGGVIVWDAKSMTVVQSFLIPGERAYRAIAFSPDGLWLAVGSSGGAVTVVEPISGEVVKEVGRHDQHTSVVSFGNDQRLLVSSSDRLGYQWDLRQMEFDPSIDATSAWKMLHQGSGEESFTATEWFLANPDELLELVNSRELVEASTADDDQIEQWISEVVAAPENSESARRRLLEHVYAARPMIEDTLESDDDSPLKPLYQSIIDHQLKPGPRRVASLLHQIDSESSRAILSKWAEQSPQSVYGYLASMYVR